MIFSLFNSGNPQYEELSQEEYRVAFNTYFKALRNYVYYHSSDAGLAEDIAQDAFVKLWETRSRIDKKTIRAYLYTIAHNLMLNQFKHNQVFYKFRYAITKDRDNDTPEKIAEIREYGDKLQQVLSQLPDGGREVFLMNRLDDLTYNEIAARLGLSVKAIEKRMTKVLKILREKLGVEI